jgi:hypothetical protein
MSSVKFYSDARIRLFDLLRRRPRSTRYPFRRTMATTYYDSQSGLHVPVHNEKEIKLFLNVNYPARQDSHQIPSLSVPHQLYKNQDDSGDMVDKLDTLARQGIHGLILPPIQFPRDVRNLKTLISIAPPSFTFLYSYASQDLLLPHIADITTLKTANDEIMSNHSIVLEYRHYNHDGNEQGRAEMNASFALARQNGLTTTLSITERAYADDDVQPITIANTIGTLIDTVKGCDRIWISCQSPQGNDAIVPICEELMYLDVAGPTMKSRLLIDLVDEDILEEVMFAGVNKFVIDDESHIERVENVAVDQGKCILR